MLKKSSSLSAPVHWHCQAPVLGTCPMPKLEKCSCSQDVNNQPVNLIWCIPPCEGGGCLTHTHSICIEQAQLLQQQQQQLVSEPGDCPLIGLIPADKELTCSWHK